MFLAGKFKCGRNKNSLTFETNVPLFMILLLLRRNELGDVEIVRWVMVDGFG